MIVNHKGKIERVYRDPWHIFKYIYLGMIVIFLVVMTLVILNGEGIISIK